MLQTDKKWIVASQSPRRKEIFKMLELPFEIVVSNTEEGGRQTDESVENYAMRLARDKAEAVAQSDRDAVVIGADTVVSLQGKLLPKPRTKEEAAFYLRLLSGRTHDVITGVAISHREKTHCFYERTIVHFHALDEAMIRAYVETGDSLDKAGAYGIQTLGALCVAKIEGDYHNVVGLPLTRLVRELRALQLITIGDIHAYA